MIHRGSSLLLCCFLTFISLSFSARAQITIEGVTDRNTYSGSVSFRVPGAAGFNDAVLLDGEPVLPDVSHQVTEANYHELFVSRTNASTLEVTSQLVRFIVRAPDRGNTEDGLPTWTPYPTIPSAAAELAGAHIELLMPSEFPANMEIPVVAWIRNAQGGVVRANGLLTAPDQPSIFLRRGVGSGFLASTNSAGTLNYTARLAGVEVSKPVVIEADTVWTPVSGTLAGNITWDEGSRIAVTGHLTVPAGSTLTISGKTVVRLGSGLNITNLGRILINGSSGEPVVFTPVTRAQPWGGFFLMGDASRLDASGAIFVAAGAQQSGFPGHRNEQPLFYISTRGQVALTNCAAIYLAGQFHHSFDRSPPYASVTLVGSLIQRCTTAGEFNGCSLRFLDSALIEVPSEDGLYCDDPDCDHDGFYLNQGVHELRDSLIGWLKDDCIDAGSGGGPSTVTVSNCWIEAGYHEALAWSGGERQTRTYDTVLINNGQGLEAGWSGGANTPLVYASGLLSLANAVGARYGDNYQGTSGLGLKDGFLGVTNSILVYNYRDVWGQVWDGTWNYRVNDMDIHDNWLTVPNTNHPNNAVWNPLTDGPKLAAFMTTPPDAPVGIGLAIWDTEPLGALLTNGIPVRLSSFTTNVVSVDYAVQTAAGMSESGTVTFLPGETVRHLTLQTPNLAGQDLARVILRNPVGGEITGRADLYFANLPPAGGPTSRTFIPSGAEWNYADFGTNQGTAWRTLNFDDSQWLAGNAELGNGDSSDGRPEATMINIGPNNARYPTTYFRRQFVVNNPSAFENVIIRLLYDDGAVVYVNTQEVWRVNLPAPPAVISFSTYTGGSTPSETTYYSNVVSAAVLAPGINLCAVEIHQANNTSSDLGFDLALIGVSPPAPPTLYLRQLGGDHLLLWSDPSFILEHTDALPGNWSPVSGATSPHVIDFSGAARFFRLRRP